MAVKKKVESTTTKKVKNYGKEYIQNIKLDVENQTEVEANFIYTTAPTGFWKHNLPSEASFSVTGNGFVINNF